MSPDDGAVVGAGGVDVGTDDDGPEVGLTVAEGRVLGVVAGWAAPGGGVVPGGATPDDGPVAAVVAGGVRATPQMDW